MRCPTLAGRDSHPIFFVVVVVKPLSVKKKEIFSVSILGEQIGHRAFLLYPVLQRGYLKHYPPQNIRMLSRRQSTQHELDIFCSPSHTLHCLSTFEHHFPFSQDVGQSSLTTRKCHLRGVSQHSHLHNHPPRGPISRIRSSCWLPSSCGCFEREVSTRGEFAEADATCLP